MLDKDSSEEQLKSARKETERLRAENAHLRAMLGIPDSAVERASPPEVYAVETLNSRAIEGFADSGEGNRGSGLIVISIPG